MDLKQYPISFAISAEASPITIEFDFTDVGIQRINYFGILGDITVKSSDSIDFGKMADPCTFDTSECGGTVNLDAVYNNFKLDNVKNNLVMMKSVIESNGKIAKGKNVHINL